MIFSKGSNVNDSIFGKSQEPIRAIIEQGVEAFEQMSQIKNIYCMDTTKNFAEKYTQETSLGNFENVGYAREGKLGIYNILINEEVQTIVALGAGTVTKRVFEDGRIERCDNVKDVALYIEKIDEMIERKRKLLSDPLE